MATTTGHRSRRGWEPGTEDDILGTTGRPDAIAPRRSLVQRLASTTDDVAPMVARLSLGLVMLPHAAQKLFGWFGGAGLGGTYQMFTRNIGIPGWLAAIAIATEIVCSLALIVGLFTRAAALGIIGVMIGTIVTVHGKNGFFMNWTGAKGGEGFEYALLAIALGLVCLIAGGGRGSADHALTQR